jgi:hypothetical protein
MIFSLRFGVTVSGGESFQGDAGGLSTPGAGARFGDVSTDNLARLYIDTRSFQLIVVAGLFSVRSSTPRAGAGRGRHSRRDRRRLRRVALAATTACCPTKLDARAMGGPGLEPGTSCL